MFIRNYKGEIIFFDTNKFKDENQCIRNCGFKCIIKNRRIVIKYKSNIIDYIKDKK